MISVGLTGLILACLSSVCSLTSIDIPMDVHRGLPVVEVWIDGSGPFRFGIDTGAMDRVVLGESLAARLGAADPKTDPKDAGTVEAPDGGAVTVESIRIGDLLFSGIPAKQSDLLSHFPMRIDGILGLHLFEDFLLTLDYPGRRVRLEHAELPQADGITVLPVERHPTGLAFVELEVAGRTHDALVDTGNLAAAAYLPKSLATQLEWASDSSARKVARTAGGEITIEEVRLAGVIRLGALVLDQPVVVFGETIGKVILGGQAFGDCVVSIDQKNWRLRLIQ